jgi:hypothetical protein
LGTVDRANEDGGATPTERLNYFNYFTEVEEEFVRRRGKALLISPMDWALVESWKNAGIPLHVVLRAINRAFDSYDARARKYRKVNSVFYCQQEVESTYAEYRLSQVGASDGSAAAEGAAEQPAGAKAGKKTAQKGAAKEPASMFPKHVLLDFIARSAAELHVAAEAAGRSARAELGSAIERSLVRLAEIANDVESAALVDAEALERDLDGIDRMLVEGMEAAAGEGGIKAIRAEAEAQLHTYRKKMDKSIYDQTVRNFVHRRLREMNQVPRLSLFYI